MEKVRIGVVGTGAMGSLHLTYINGLEGAEIAAICDIAPGALKAVSEKYPGIPAFASHKELLAAKVCDAIIIATPHYFHPPIAIDAFANGIHVLSEKPLAVYTKAGQEAVDAHRQTSGLVFGIMFQSRAIPVWRKAKELIESGAIGAMRRVSWIITKWFRSQAYYDSGGWRATWSGEGGGVLLNQCPHNLDMLQWLVGMPSRVFAQCALGKYHRIEVEDDVQALLEYSNGATGQFVTNTCEAPGADRLEIVGEKGRIVVEDGSRLTLDLLPDSIQTISDTTLHPYAIPEFKTEQVQIEAAVFGWPHAVVTQNFVKAILNGDKLIAPAAEGMNQLTLGNAMLMSGLKKAPVDIPFDGDAYKAMLDELIAGSTFQKKVRDTEKPSVWGPPQ